MNRQLAIESRIKAAFNPKVLLVIDESKHHYGHGGYHQDGSHFKVTLSTEAFPGLSSMQIHRKIYALFSDMIPDTIHALSIQLYR